MAQKEIFLEIHRLSSFVNFTPKQTLNTYEDLKKFLSVHINNITDLEYFDLVELNFYLTLVIGKFVETQICLDRLLDKFGDIQSERIAVLKTTYLHIAKGSSEEAVKYLKLRPLNEMQTMKKRIAISKSNNDPDELITALVAYTKLAPTDVETWSELAETYAKIGYYEQAIFSYEETLLVQPFNYVVHGRLGELSHLLFLQNDNTKTTSKEKKNNNLLNLINASKFFSRSVELCSNFVRGWSGLYIVSDKLADQKTDAKVNYKRVKELAETRLKDIIDKQQASFDDIGAAKKILKLQ